MRTVEVRNLPYNKKEAFLLTRGTKVNKKASFIFLGGEDFGKW